MIPARIKESGAEEKTTHFYSSKRVKRPLFMCRCLELKSPGSSDPAERLAGNICCCGGHWGGWILIFIKEKNGGLGLCLEYFTSRTIKVWLVLYNRCWILSVKPQGERLDLYSPLHVSASLVSGHVLIRFTACHSSRPDDRHAPVFLWPGWGSNPVSFCSERIAPTAEPLALTHLILFLLCFCLFIFP